MARRISKPKQRWLGAGKNKAQRKEAKKPLPKELMKLFESTSIINNCPHCDAITHYEPNNFTCHQCNQELPDSYKKVLPWGSAK